MSIYRKKMAERAPDLDPSHLEAYAFAIGSTLEDMPDAFFDDVAEAAIALGPFKLAKFYEWWTA